MNKHAKGIITVVAVLAVVAACYHFFNRNSTAYAKLIIKLNGTTASVAQLTAGLQEGFLKAWAKALAKGKQAFNYNGSEYNTTGGKKITA